MGDNLLGNIPSGLQVVVNDSICITIIRQQIRWPLSKKRRIRRKWSKDYKRNFVTQESHRSYIIYGVCYVSAKIKERLDELFPLKK